MAQSATGEHASRVVRDTPEREREWLEWICWLTDFAPHAKQREALALHAEALYTGVYCGRRWGKSKLVARIGAAGAMRQQEQIVWCIAPTYELTKRVYRPLKYLMHHVIPRRMVQCGLKPIRVIRSLDSTSERLMELSNGSVIQAKSADNPTSLLGEGVNLALLDESGQMPIETWEEYIMPTLLDTNGMSVHATTPQGFDWNYDNFVRGQEQRDEWRSIQSPSWDNPHLPPLAVDRFQRILSPASFDQEIGAKFTVRSGRVFGDFSRALHVKPTPIDAHLAIVLGIDFGYRTFAFVACQIDKHGMLRQFLDAEWHDITLPQAIARLHDYGWIDRVTQIACDPAGGAVNTKTGTTDVWDLEEAFPYAEVLFSHNPQHKNPEWRASQLRNRLFTAAGTTHYQCDPCCEATIKMLEQSVYSKRPRVKTEPVKDEIVDHIRDALGYLEANLFHVGAMEVTMGKLI